MSTIRQFQVTFDCAEPARLAAFWCEVLGYVVPDVPEGYATWEEYHATLPAEDEIYFACTDPSGAGPRVLFQRVPEGKVVKNRVHLDVRAAGTGLKGDERLAALEAECARLTALGATHVLTQRADGVNESCITMQDIEGNEFCLG